MKTLRNDVMLLLGLIALSAGIGFAANALKREPLSLTYRTPAQRLTGQAKGDGKEVSTLVEAPMVSREIEIIALDRLQSLKEKQDVLILDVRPDLFYKLGHIPGAHSLQAKEFESDYAKIKPQIETTLSQGRKIVVYCAGTHCPDAGKVTKKLSELGHGNLLIFEAGWEGWREAGGGIEGRGGKF